MDRKEYLKLLLLNKRPNLELSQKIEERKKAFAVDRKTKKDLRDVGRRNIDVNMSPYCTPASEKIKTKTHLIGPRNQPNVNTEEVNRRLEMLAQWKVEKAKSQQQSKRKPIFKVSKVSSDSTTNLENANRFIKGKPIVSSTYKSKFAPDNHSFKAPSVANVPSAERGQNTHTTPKKKPAGLKKTTELSSRAAGCSKDNGSGMNLRRSDRIKGRMAKLEDKHGSERNFQGGVRSRGKEVPINNPKRGFNGKMPKVMEEGQIPDLLKVTTAERKFTPQETIPEGIENHESGHVTDAHNIDNATFTMSAEDGSSKRAADNIANLSAINGNDENGKKENESTLTRESPVATKSKGKRKEKRTPYRKHIKSSTPVSDADECLHDVALDLEGSRNTGECSSWLETKVSSEKSEVDYSTPNRKSPASTKSKGKRREKSTPYRTAAKSTPLTDVDHVLHDITSDLQSDHITPGRTSSSKSTDIAKKKKTPQSIKKDSIASIGDIKKLSTEQDEKERPPVYVSPFVTINRGKKNSRDEYKIRHSTGENISMKNTDIDISRIVNIHTSPTAAADYFMAQLNRTICKINEMCEKWQTCLQDPELPEEAIPSINVTIGQSKLLISKKFEQFRKLILQSKKQDVKESCIKCDDLHGFWDMIYLQVEDLEKRFDNLERFKENNWVEMLPEKTVAKKPAKIRMKKPAANSRLRDMIKAARENRNKLKNNLGEECPEVRTPTGHQQIQNQPHSNTKRRSLRVSLVAEDQRKSSPGLAMMKLSQSIKHGDGLTPAKSILKADRVKSTGKKSVTFGSLSSTCKMTPTALFIDEGKENTPCILRRSHRTAKQMS